MRKGRRGERLGAREGLKHLRGGGLISITGAEDDFARLARNLDRAQQGVELEARRSTPDCGWNRRKVGAL
jgi:hypothetical protein